MTTTEARTMSKTTIEYSIQMQDSEQPAAWMRLVEQMTPGNQDSGRCHWTARVRPEMAAWLEAALDADDDVLSYEDLGRWQHDDEEVQS